MTGCVLRPNCSLNSYRCLPNIPLWQSALSLPTCPPKCSSISAQSLSSSPWHPALALTLASMSLAPPPDLPTLRIMQLLISCLLNLHTQGTARPSLQTKSVNLKQINHNVLPFYINCTSGTCLFTL